MKPTKPECQTDGLQLEGAHGWTPTMYIRLVQDFGLECEVAQHLATSYGDRAFAVAKLANLTGKRWPVIGNKIHPEFPYIDAEVIKHYNYIANKFLYIIYKTKFLFKRFVMELENTLLRLLI